jgi:hypothetical protein
MPDPIDPDVAQQVGNIARQFASKFYAMGLNAPDTVDEVRDEARRAKDTAEWRALQSEFEQAIIKLLSD